MICCFCACSKTDKQYAVKYFQGFSVHYLDVLDGDAIFIHFPDGKNMLIDCGKKSDKTLKTIERALKVYSVKDIDYLILTHSDSNHIGNAISIINSYNIKCAYVNNILTPENFPEYNSIISLLEKDKIETKKVNKFDMISGENYSAVFLLCDCSNLNGNENPSESDIDSSSMVLYLEYKGIRFLFTGDVGERQEDEILTNYNLRLYSHAGRNVVLEDLDFLKVSREGKGGATSSKFLSKINPKNAVISTGNKSIPSAEVLYRINDISPNCKIYRTDTVGSISVFVDEKGEVQVETQG